MRFVFNLYDIFAKTIEPEVYLTVTLGVTGIYMSVKAFREASIAAQEARNVSKALPNFFYDFTHMVSKFSALIDEAKTELLVFVSLPSYGSLPDPKSGSIFHEHFYERINSCKRNDSQLDIKFICFSQRLCDDFEDIAKKESEKYLPDRYFRFKEDILEGLRYIRRERLKKESGYENVKCIDSEDQNIRMFIADKRKAIFSVVPDFSPKNPSEFNITGFETQDKTMVDILEKLFYKYYQSTDSVNDSEHKEWKYN